MATLLMETTNLRIMQVADGVYAAMESANSLAGSNAAFVDLGDRVVVFDTFLSLDAASELRDAIARVCGKAPQCVVVSHMHSDHMIGNQVFDDALILASDSARAGIISETAAEIAQIQARNIGDIARFEQAVLTEQDPDRLFNIQNTLKFLRNLIRPDLHIRMPDASFTGRLTFAGKDQELQMQSLEMAHSAGDVFGYLPKARVCLAGDLLFTSEPPWIGSGDPNGLLKACEQLLALDAEYYVPGHGPLATKADIHLQVKYVNELITLAKQRMAAGQKTLARQDFSPEFREWGGAYRWNIDWVFGWLARA